MARQSTTCPPISGGSIRSSSGTPCSPHLDVFENIAFGLRVNRKSNNLTEKRSKSGSVSSMLELVNLSGYEKRTADLSFGRRAAAGGHCPRLGQPPPACCCWTSPWARWTLKLRKEMQRELKRHPAATGHHLHLRYPRPGGSPDHERYHRGHEARASSSRWARPLASTTSRSTPLWPTSSARATLSHGIMHEDFDVLPLPASAFECTDQRLWQRRRRWTWSSAPRT